ncbi:carboxypeptidase regulatory-like domain-containing protein [Aeoliella sp. SH292]|uniref:carboxypeptidase regulatory-like domain-containing protein n=1 Tax=Aeoliella sp. SH292 TaxID=3454464 RepID=UPI003F9D69E2
MIAPRLAVFTLIAAGLCVSLAAAKSAELMPVTVTCEPASGTPAITTRGVITDAAGKPLTGATVVLRANLGGIQYAGGMEHCRDVLARTTTNQLGEFALENIAIPPRLVESIAQLRKGEPGAQVLAWAPGLGLAWQDIDQLEDTQVELQLQKQVEVTGVAVDADGTPIADGELKVSGFTKSKDSMDGFLRAPGDMNLIRSEIEFAAPIRDGEFALPNLPEDYRVSVRLQSPTGHRSFFVVDTAKDGADVMRTTSGGRETVAIHRSPIRLTVSRQPYITAKVLDADGKPVVHGGLQAIDPEQHYGGSSAVNSEGLATLIVNKPGVHTVYFGSDPLHPAIGFAQEIDIQPGDGQVVEFRLPASRSIQGRVVDSDTGEPVPGVYVATRHQSKDSVEDKSLPRATGSAGVSGKDGRFELPVTDGEYTFAIRHEVHGYLAPTFSMLRGTEIEVEFPTVTVGPDSPTEEVVLKLGRGLVVEGTVVDQQGTPIAAAHVVAMQQRGYHQWETTTDEEGRYRVAGIPPFGPIIISTWSQAGGSEQVVPASEDQPWNETLTKTVDLTITSATSLKGRVVQAGEPVAGVKIELHRSPPAVEGEEGVRFRLAGETKSDAEGKFQFNGLEKGDRYYLTIEPRADAEVRDWQYSMPYSRTVEVENGSTIELPDAEFKRNGQTLAGVVVDPDGNPVEGITVSAQLASGRHLPSRQNGASSWVTTDAHGRFRLIQLPDEPLSLMAYKSNPAGGTIPYPARVKTEMNDDAIRIVLDPTLTEEPEDLDKPAN